MPAPYASRPLPGTAQPLCNVCLRRVPLVSGCCPACTATAQAWGMCLTALATRFLEVVMETKKQAPREIIEAHLATLTPEQRARVTTASHGTHTDYAVDGKVYVCASNRVTESFVAGAIAEIDRALAKPVPGPKTRTAVIRNRYRNNARVTWRKEGTTWLAAVDNVIRAAWACGVGSDDDVANGSTEQIIAAIDEALAKSVPQERKANVTSTQAAIAEAEKTNEVGTARETQAASQAEGRAERERCTAKSFSRKCRSSPSRRRHRASVRGG